MAAATKHNPASPFLSSVMVNSTSGSSLTKCRLRMSLVYFLAQTSLATTSTLNVQTYTAYNVPLHNPVCMLFETVCHHIVDDQISQGLSIAWYVVSIQDFPNLCGGYIWALNPLCGQ
jgi:hypothetical protein